MIEAKVVAKRTFMTVTVRIDLPDHFYNKLNEHALKGGADRESDDMIVNLFVKNFKCAEGMSIDVTDLDGDEDKSWARLYIETEDVKKYDELMKALS